MSGIAFDNGNFWVATYYPDPGKIYRIDGTGNILAEFQSHNQQPWDICLENDHLWVVDYYGNMIYRMDDEGNIQESYPSEGDRPAGIVYDGAYLWYVDGPLGSSSTLYKIDLGGAGTPALYLPEDEHDIGIVTIGDSAVWSMQVDNVGDAPLTIHSNDPVNPQVPVTVLGEGALSGPSIDLPEDFHDFSYVRNNAYTRWLFEVRNLGDEPLLISQITIDDPHFILDENPALPYEIPVLDAAIFGVWFHPETAVHYHAILSLFSNDPDNNPFEVSVEGFGDDSEYPMGELLWQFTVDLGYDNSPKAIISLPDITGDGVDEVIVCPEDDYVRCLNGNASGTADLLWIRELYSGAVYRQQGVTVSPDIDGDGSMEVVTGGRNGSVLCFSGGLNSTVAVPDSPIHSDNAFITIYPNPFHDITTIEFFVDVPGEARVCITDINSRIVKY